MTPATTSPRPAARGVGQRQLRGWPALALASLLLCGCSSLSRSTLGAVKLAVHGNPPPKPSLVSVVALPYYQLLATTPKAGAVLLLGNIDGTRLAWYGKPDVVVVTEHGRVVQTHGLPTNLAGLQAPANDPFAHGLQHLTAPVHYRLREDWSPDYRYGVPIDVTLVPAGRSRIEIIGIAHEVLRVDEQLSSPALDYHVTNHYWVDVADGFIWKSEQRVADGVTLQLEQLRPYRGQP